MFTTRSFKPAAAPQSLFSCPSLGRGPRRALAARVLASLLASTVAAGGFTSTSCASGRLPSGLPLRTVAGGYELQVLLDGTPAPTYQHAGETYILGQLGARYTLRIVNHTGRRVEAVAAVDGRDAMDGKPADVRTKRGYVVGPWSSVDVEGWRLSHAEVAAFRFSSVADSYAARTGSAREVGVIGVAIFPERLAPLPPPRPVYTPPPYGYRVPQNGNGDLDDFGHPEAQVGKSRSSSEPRSLKSAPAKRDSSDNVLGGRADLPSPSPSPSPSRSPASGGALARGEAMPSPRSRPGLGTEFGESLTSRVQDVDFVRANSVRPAVVLGARYNDREGLLALGIDLDRCCGAEPDQDLALRQSATPFPASDRRYAAPPAGWHRGCCVGY
ncbi:MAG: hypothetical protein ABIS92_01035 [Polyangia bacterium]